MTMQTTLSDEEMVERRNMRYTVSDSTPLSVHFLIANARLEFDVNHRKDSPLKISNRERIAIFHPHSHIKLQGCRARGANVPLACPEEDHRRRRAPESLIATFATPPFGSPGVAADSDVFVYPRVKPLGGVYIS